MARRDEPFSSTDKDWTVLEESCITMVDDCTIKVVSVISKDDKSEVATSDGMLSDADCTMVDDGCIIIDEGCTLRHCLLYTSPSPRDRQKSRMPSSA